MEENVSETVRKVEDDDQWNRFHESEAENGQKEQPSERQKAYIVSLSRAVGLKMDLSRIEDRAKASRIISSLQLLNRRTNGSRQIDELRDRKVAFGMATKLIFRRYGEQQKDPRKWKRFWKDVHAFYDEYQEQQELATSTQEM